MNVIAYRTIRAFTDVHPEAEASMREWYNALSKLQPRNFAELKTEFSSVDLVHLRGGEGVYVFDVGGNKYRIIVKLDFEFRVGFILYAFTHHEYTKWNKGGRP